jgi:Flp pilus assembly pilin Flp
MTRRTDRGWQADTASSVAEYLALLALIALTLVGVSAAYGFQVSTLFGSASTSVSQDADADDGAGGGEGPPANPPGPPGHPGKGKGNGPP